ncbi:hypothetical protein D3C87_1747440 [compost metagenome]
MKKYIAVALLVLSSSISLAQDSSISGSIMTFGPWTTYSYTPNGSTSEGMYSDVELSFTDVNDRKIILRAKEDAGVFVATAGEVETARFIQAVQVVKKNIPAANEAEVLEIAQFIIAIQE